MEGHINYPKTQTLLGEIRKGKVLKEVNLVEKLPKSKQNWVYVPQCKLRLVYLKEKYVPLPSIKEEKTIIEYYQGGNIADALKKILPTLRRLG